MKSNAKRSALGLSSALSLSLIIIVSPASAQSSPRQSAVSTSEAPAASGEGAAETGDIIVTARRVEERLQDVPISITVYNQQQLENRNIVNSQDLATYTPSMSSDTRFGSLNTSYAIRGFVQDIGTAPSVGVYFADVVSPTAAFHNLPGGNGAGPGSFFDLQNVQILKGPQGTLFGRNTTGGDVLLVPQKPTARLEGYIEGSYGNYNLERIQAVLNVPISETARFRIGVDHETRDGYLHNLSGVGPHTYDDIDYTAARASLVLDLTPNLENYTIGSFTHAEPTGSLTKLIDAGGARAPTPQPAGAALLQPLAQAQLGREQAAGYGFYDTESDFIDPYIRQNQWQLINTTTWKAADTITVKNIASYAQLRADVSSGFFGTAFDAHDIFGGFLAPPGTRISFASASPIEGEHSAAQSTTTEELQVQGNTLANKLTYQTGGYLEFSGPLGESGTTTPTLVYCQNPSAFECSAPLAAFGAGGISIDAAKTTYHNAGGYAQASYSITRQLKLTGGIRYTHDTATTVAREVDYNYMPLGLSLPSCNPAGGTLPSCAFTVREKSHAPTWLINLDYQPDDDILLYGKWARGYRAGGVTPLEPAALQTFNPEKVDAYEAGFKSTFRGAVHGTFDLAAFYNDFSNEQVQIGVIQLPSTVSTAIQNLGKSRIYGAEVETSIAVFRRFDIEAGYTYLNTRIQQVNALPALPGFTTSSTIVAGDPLPLSPKNKFTISASYLLPLDESIGQIALIGTFTYTDRQVATGESPLSDPNNPFVYLQSTHLLNLNMNWKSIARKNFDLSLYVTNVTNDRYYTAISGLLNQVGFETAAIGEPRMYGARLRYHF